MRFVSRSAGRARISTAFKVICAFFGLLALLVSPSRAQTEPGDTPTSLDFAVESFLQTHTKGLPGKVKYRVRPLARTTRLSPCDAYDPFFPPGSKAWGKTTIGVRCLGPSTWTVYLQAQINVYATYLVAANTLAAGQLIGPGDVVSRQGDLGTLPPTVLTDSAQAVGKTVRLGIGPGQPVRSDQLIAPWAVQQGQNVTTVSGGEAFSVSSSGKALNNAAEGQVVQVRTSSGQTISGIARAGGIVEITN